MHVHIVDHNTQHLPLIAKLVTSCFPGLRVLSFSKTNDTKNDHVAIADLVIVSGGTRLVHLNRGTHRRLLKRLIELQKPVFGICLGAEAIAHYFGMTLVELPERKSGVADIRLVSQDIIDYFGKNSLSVYHHHGWAIQGSSDEIEVLAESDKGIEFFRHKKLPFWGVQFHPEAKREENQGYLSFVFTLQDAGFKQKN